jgi:hypothetical protein
MKFKILCLLVMVSLISSCSGGGGDKDSSSLCSTAKVINGEACSISTSAVVSVQSIHDTGLLVICNGVVISPTKVLTSAVCLQILRGTPPNQVNFSVADSISVFVEGKKLKATNYKIHPKFNVLDFDSLLTEYDIAVLDLPESVSVRPVSIANRNAASGDQISTFEYSVVEPGYVKLGALSAGKMIVTATSGKDFQAAPTESGQKITDNVSGAPAFLLNEKGNSLGLVGVGQNASPTSVSYLSVNDPEVSSFIAANR